MATTRAATTLLVLLAAAAAVHAAPNSRSLQQAAAPAPGANGCTEVKTSYQVILRTGQGSSDTPLGLIISQNGSPVTEPSTTSRKLLQQNKAISTNPDWSTLHNVNGNLYMIVQFENPQPSTASVIALQQDRATGKLTPTSVKPVDFSKVGGAWVMCAGALSPWGSHLGGEEYEPDARIIMTPKNLMGATDSVNATNAELADRIVDYLRYMGQYNGDDMDIATVLKYFNPYNYGGVLDIQVLPDGSTNVTRYMTMGRTAKELCYIMPDNRTAYCADDGTNVGFYKFVADRPNDLSSGTLYAGKFKQLDATNGGTFNVTYIELGKGTNAEIMALVNSTKFSDIFEYQKPSNGSCPADFKSVNMGDYLQECLKLKAGMEKAAAFLETRRYAAYLGATTEFSKWEGITFSPARRQIFTSMSEVRYGMEDNGRAGKADTRYDIGGPNDVRLPWNPCGCVYAIDVDANYSATMMKGVLCGYLQDDKSYNSSIDQCSVNGLGNPDNVAIIDDSDLLIIGEDATIAHQNDLMWAYDLNNGNMARIFSTPYGSETTSPAWYPNFANGWSYLVGVIQHPYGESDQAKVKNPSSEGEAAYVGVWPLPAADVAGKTLRFASIPYPKTEAEKSTVISSQSVLACPKEPRQATYITPMKVPAPSSAPAPAPGRS